MLALRRFFKYSVVGVSTFLFDLALLFVLIDFVNMNPVPAAGVAFLIAVSVNYFLSRSFVFSETRRSFAHAYYWFIVIALAGAGIVAGCMYVFVSIFGWHYLVSRVGIAGIVGIGNYAINLFFNFRVAGVHASDR